MNWQYTLPKKLESFYKISAEKAQEEYDHIQALKNETATNYPALHLFDGLMYRNIKRDDLTKEEQTYLEKHLMITSALYGVITSLCADCASQTGLFDETKSRWKKLEKSLAGGL